MISAVGVTFSCEHHGNPLEVDQLRCIRDEKGVWFHDLSWASCPGMSVEVASLESSYAGHMLMEALDKAYERCTNKWVVDSLVAV